MSYETENRDLIRQYRAMGWTIDQTNGGHMRWRSPTGAIVIDSQTRSDSRGRKNHVARLKKHANPPSPRYN